MHRSWMVKWASRQPKTSSLSALLPPHHICVNGWITTGACGPRPGVLQQHSSGDMCMDTVEKTSSNTQLVTRWSNQEPPERMSIMGQERGGDDDEGRLCKTAHKMFVLCPTQLVFKEGLIKIQWPKSLFPWKLGWKLQGLILKVSAHWGQRCTPPSYHVPAVGFFLPFSFFPSDNFSISSYLLPAVPRASERKIHVKTGQDITWVSLKRSTRR